MFGFLDACERWTTVDHLRIAYGIWDTDRKQNNPPVYQSTQRWHQAHASHPRLISAADTPHWSGASPRSIPAAARRRPNPRPSLSTAVTNPIPATATTTPTKQFDAHRHDAVLCHDCQPSAGLLHRRIRHRPHLPPRCAREGVLLLKRRYQGHQGRVLLRRPVGRLFRHRLLRGGPRAQWRARKGHPRRGQGAPGRFRLHCQRGRRVPLLLQQRDEHIRREAGRLRDCRTIPRYTV